MVQLRIVRITDAAATSIHNHVSSVLTEEACGALVGHLVKNEVYVESTNRITNLYGTQSYFAISSAALELTISEARRKLDAEVVGIYHSHLHSNVEPSLVDRKNMQLYPFVWLIIDATTATTENWRCYRIVDGRVVHLPHSIESGWR